MSDIVKKVALKLVMKKVIAQVAFLSYPVIGPIACYFIEKWLMPIIEELLTYFGYVIVDLEHDVEKKNYKNALVEVLTTMDPKKYTQEERDAARRYYRKTLADLGHIDH